VQGLQLKGVSSHHQELRWADVAADDKVFQRPKKSYPRCTTLASSLSNRMHWGVVDTPGNRAMRQTEISQSLAVLADCSQVTRVQAIEVVKGEAGEAR